MDELNPTERTEDTEPVRYEAPALEQRSSSRDPLVWTVTSPICL